MTQWRMSLVDSARLMVGIRQARQFAEDDSLASHAFNRIAHSWQPQPDRSPARVHHALPQLTQRKCTVLPLNGQDLRGAHVPHLQLSRVQFQLLMQLILAPRA